MPPFCSVIVPTVGRATLSRAIASVAAQTIGAGEVEIIVVNDSGAPLKAGPWQRASPRIITTCRRERSVARNAGAAVAHGRYLCFLDDDDWLLPDALARLAALARGNPDAVWLSGGVRVVDDRGRVLGESNSHLQGNAFAQVLGGAWVPLQASLIRTDAFFDVGGFDPSICGTEDLDLCRRISSRGELACLGPPVACLFRGEGWRTSTDYQRAAGDTRRSRDRLLDAPGALTRVSASARRAPDGDYWFGRAVRVCLSAAHLNLRNGRPFAAASRLVQSVAVIVAAGRTVTGQAFWQGVVAEHVPGSLHFIVQASEEKSTRRPPTVQRPPTPAPAFHGRDTRH